MDRKGQTGGLLSGIVAGVAGLVIVLIIAFVMISALTGSETLYPSTSNTTTNESQNTTVSIVYANGSTIANQYRVLAETGTPGRNARAFVITDLWSIENTAYQTQANATWRARFSIDNDGRLNNNSQVNATEFSNISITYTNLVDGTMEGGVNRLAGNFTDGTDNVSRQIPTLLLIAVIVVLIGILGILVAVWFKSRSSDSL